MITRISVCFLCAYTTLMAASADDVSQFNQRYLNENRSGVSEGRDVAAYRMKTTDIQTLDMNLSKYAKEHGFQQYESRKDDPAMYDTATAINKNVRSREFQKTVGKHEQYIINDKQLDWSKYLGGYKSQTNSLIKQMQEEGRAYASKNEVLGEREKLIVVISSSMPDDLVRRYFEAFSGVNHDVQFVMRGMIGGPTKFRPTGEYIARVMSKDPSKPSTDKENLYEFDVSVNPKITQRYGITKVPAVLYVDNYDPIAELQTANKPVSSNENYWVVYGDIDPAYAIERINETARRESLKHLLAAMNRGYYNEKRKK